MRSMMRSDRQPVSSPSLVPAAAAACSSSRPSRPAATPRHRPTATDNQDRHLMSAGATSRTRIAKRVPRWSSHRPRRCSAGQLPGIAFHTSCPASLSVMKQSRADPTSRRHHLTGTPSCPRSHHRSQSNRHSARPQSAPHLPRVPSLEAFGRRPRCQPNRRDGPSSETLHNSDRLEDVLACLLSAPQAAVSRCSNGQPLFDHLVGEREQRRRHREAEHLGGLAG